MSISDNWCTPTWITAILPTVDLDPCSNAASTVRARVALSAGGCDDSWRSLGHAGWSPVATAFVNPPYSVPRRWCERAVEFSDAGNECLLLVKLDPTTRWWGVLMDGRPTIYPFRKRITFATGPGLVAGCTANFPSALVHLGPSLTAFELTIGILTTNKQVWKWDASQTS